MSLFKTYYHLTKPGIIYGNDLTAIGGFMLASAGDIEWLRFVAMLLGISLVMASGCVFNNVLDRGIDKKMARTKQRALVTGKVSVRSALVYGTVLGAAGLSLLAVYTTMLAAGVALFGLFAYVVLYGFAKRQSVHGTAVGSLAGAVPPVVGYTAVTGVFDSGAWLLLLILVCWQMPHFYAIAIYRKEEYAAAGLPVLPVKKGLLVTKVQIFCYVLTFIAATMLLAVFGYAGWTYVAVMLAVGLAWLRLAYIGFRVQDSIRWAKGLFGYSLVVLLVFSLMISITWLLP